jgi:hypothetical protein
MAVKSAAILEKRVADSGLRLQCGRRRDVLGSPKSRGDPRPLSFAGVLNVVDCAWCKLAAATTPELQREIARILKLAAQCTLPKRRRRSYPRVLWHRQPGFPFRKGEN